MDANTEAFLIAMLASMRADGHATPGNTGQAPEFLPGSVGPAANGGNSGPTPDELGHGDGGAENSGYTLGNMLATIGTDGHATPGNTGEAPDFVPGSAAPAPNGGISGPAPDELSDGACGVNGSSCPQSCS